MDLHVSPGYTGFRGELEHVKIKTRLIGESFGFVMDECDLEAIDIVYYNRYTPLLGRLPYQN